MYLFIFFYISFLFSFFSLHYLLHLSFSLFTFSFSSSISLSYVPFQWKMGLTIIFYFSMTIIWTYSRKLFRHFLRGQLSNPGNLSSESHYWVSKDQCLSRQNIFSFLMFPCGQKILRSTKFIFSLSHQKWIKLTRRKNWCMFGKIKRDENFKLK